MKKTDNLSRLIRQLRVPASSTLDEKVHAAITQAAGRPTPAAAAIPDLSLWQILSIVMKKKPTQ